MIVTLPRLRRRLRDFGGVLRYGGHTGCTGKVCALELLSMCRTKDEDEKTDSYTQLGSWNLASLNDMIGGEDQESDQKTWDQLRTEKLLPLIAMYGDALNWPAERQKQVAKNIIDRCVAELGVWQPRPDDYAMTRFDGGNYAGAVDGVMTDVKRGDKTVFAQVCQIWEDACRLPSPN